VCAILDASVVAAVFRPDPPPGAREFRRWLESGRGRLAIGGKLRKELSASREFKAWLQQAILRGGVANVPDALVDDEARSLSEEACCSSNDEHVLALARLGGARLLYSRDEALREDFKGRPVRGKPSGQALSGDEGGRMPPLATAAEAAVLEVSSCGGTANRRPTPRARPGERTPSRQTGTDCR